MNSNQSDRLIAGFADRVTRRSFLGRCTRTLFWASGITVLTLPANRLGVRKADASHVCNDALWCGLCGVACSECGVAHQCPSGTSRGSTGWPRCCCFPDSFCSVIRYYDCCSNGQFFCGGDCDNNCPQDTWCPAAPWDDYYCTVAVAQGPC